MSETFVPGKHCGSCVRGSESPTNPTCKECWKIELDTKQKFTKWEGKK